MQPKPRRPTGVTILGILSILAGLGGIVVGAGVLALSGLVASAYPGGAAVAAVIGAILLIIGILELVYGFGFFGDATRRDGFNAYGLDGIWLDNGFDGYDVQELWGQHSCWRYAVS